MLRWAEVAANCGRSMHRLAQFHAISRPNARAPIETVEPPAQGNLQPNLLRSLCSVLRRHTRTPDSCWFCLWTGHGWLDDRQSVSIVFTKVDEPSDSSGPDAAADDLSPALRAAVQNDARVRLPQRDYLLLTGPLEAAMEIGWTLAGDHFIPQSPNLFWPADHAWCVASEIDLFCTLVAGPSELAEDLMAEPRLEAWRVLPDDPVHAYSDEINK
jgi:hypothetical protein